MAYNEKLTNRLREAFADTKNVEELKMFRGIAFMVNGKMCITVGDDEIMCRIDPAMQETALEKKGTRAVIMRGREYKGYVKVQEDVLKTKKDLESWIRLALDFNKFAKASKKTKRGSKKSTGK